MKMNSETVPNGTRAAYHHWSQRLAFPENLEFYLKTTASANEVIKTSRGWKPVGWEYLGNSKPYVPVKKE